jgi:hypothetical protein
MDRTVRPTHYLGRHQESTADRERFWEFCGKSVAPYGDAPV